MSDLIERIRAAIDHTEQLARAASPGPWEARGCDPTQYNNNDPYVTDSGGGLIACFTQVYPECAIAMDDDDARHIAHNDPAAVLRRCATDRKILALHQPSPNFPHECVTCGDFGDCGCARGNDGWPCETIQALAEAYKTTGHSGGTT